jgi:YfiH family protein
MNTGGSCNLYPFKIEGALRKYAVFSFIFDGKAVDEISCVITLRAAGNMENERERGEIFSRLGIAGKKLFHCAQTHSRNAAVVAENDADTLHAADGLVTGSGGAGLYVFVADCLPVFLFDTLNGAFSVLHSGWKGTGIVENALRLMEKSYGTRPENVSAVLGPCIRSCCYNVGEERALLYEKEFGGAGTAEFPLGPAVQKKESGDGTKWYIDMQAANAALLVKNNVYNISYCINCTFMDEYLGSYRRQGANFTKMMALAARLDESKRGNYV